MTTVDPYYADELGVATYDLLMGTSSVAAAGDVAFYEACGRRFGDPVLELAVGTGRIAWPLADAGLRVVGIDLSAAMLERAARQGAGRPAAVRERVTLHQADMASFALAETFPLATIPYSAFQHLLIPERQRAALACTRRHLVPGGHLVVDVFDPLLEHCVPGAASPIPDREAVDPASGHLIRRRTVDRRCDPLRQTIAARKWRICSSSAASRWSSSTRISTARRPPTASGRSGSCGAGNSSQSPSSRSASTLRASRSITWLIQALTLWPRAAAAIKTRRRTSSSGRRVSLPAQLFSGLSPSCLHHAI
jgi:SAM-dependent methyltransferase